MDMTIKLDLSKVTKDTSKVLIKQWKESIPLLKEQQYLASQKLIELQEHIEAHEEHINNLSKIGKLPDDVNMESSVLSFLKDLEYFGLGA
jgi:hypothetical protein